jgi:hypothetical protein
MKEVIITALAVSALTYAIVTFKTEPKPTFEHPYIYWQDRVHRPEHGFETSVDIYENEVGDTIYMQLSYGYEND